jgi:AraC-like DNA-binding protein
VKLTNEYIKVFRQVKELIDKTYRQKIPIPDLAKRSSLSVSKLEHEFSNIYGQSVSGYISGLRMNEAKRLLETTSHSLLYIALSVGYKRAGSFIVAFKKAFGITPLQYRKAFRKGIRA